jgi:hypothetical protein
MFQGPPPAGLGERISSARASPTAPLVPPPPPSARALYRSVIAAHRTPRERTASLPGGPAAALPPEAGSPTHALGSSAEPLNSGLSSVSTSPAGSFSRRSDPGSFSRYGARALRAEPTRTGVSCTPRAARTLSGEHTPTRPLSLDGLVLTPRGPEPSFAPALTPRRQLPAAMRPAPLNPAFLAGRAPPHPPMAPAATRSPTSASSESSSSRLSERDDDRTPPLPVLAVEAARAEQAQGDPQKNYWNPATTRITGSASPGFRQTLELGRVILSSDARTRG